MKYQEEWTPIFLVKQIIFANYLLIQKTNPELLLTLRGFSYPLNALRGHKFAWIINDLLLNG